MDIKKMLEESTRALDLELGMLFKQVSLREAEELTSPSDSSEIKERDCPQNSV